MNYLIADFRQYSTLCNNKKRINVSLYVFVVFQNIRRFYFHSLVYFVCYREQILFYVCFFFVEIFVNFVYKCILCLMYWSLLLSLRYIIASLGIFVYVDASANWNTSTIYFIAHSTTYTLHGIVYRMWEQFLCIQPLLYPQP